MKKYFVLTFLLGATSVFASDTFANSDTAKINYYTAQAHSAFKKGDTVLVMKYVDSILILEPNNKFMLVEQATVCLWLKLYDKALININKALELETDKKGFYYRTFMLLRGLIYLESKKYNEALADFKYIEKLGDKDENHIDVYLYLALSYKGLNNKELACNYYKKYLKKGGKPDSGFDAELISYCK